MGVVNNSFPLPISLATKSYSGDSNIPLIVSQNATAAISYTEDVLRIPPSKFFLYNDFS